MPVVIGKAPGKVILFGEHAVVHGQPAIAIPVMKLEATARVFPIFETSGELIRIQAPDIQLDADLSDLPEDHPLARAVRLTLAAISPDHSPSFTLQVSSTIPVLAGMGSGAAISVAIIRGVSNFLGRPLPPAEISDLAYDVEKIHHGTPSGIDNNVVTYEKPVYFMRDKPIQFLKIKNPSYWVIADTGEKTPTHEVVSAVRAMHAKDADHYDRLFKTIGEVTQEARKALISGNLITLGPLMNENQRLLQELNVSSPMLDKLIEAARTAGAAGAKLSGSGRGGNMIALAPPEGITAIKNSLLDAGAERVITTQLIEGDS